MQDNTIKKEFDPAKKSLLNNIQREEHYVTKNTLKRLDQAINSAQSIDYPNRQRLLEIYYDIVKDPHLQTVMSLRKKRVTGLEYSVRKSNGKIDEKATAFFHQSWFKKFLNYALDSMFYGNSLVEILTNKGKPQINLIPRENIIPEFTEIKRNPSDQNGFIDYSAPAYMSSLIDMNNNNDSRNLGEFLTIAKYVMVKNEVFLNWSQFTEIFGQPIRVATTSTQDPLEFKQITDMFASQGRSQYIIKNDQTQMEFVDAGSSSSTDLFKTFETYIDEQVSKVLIGGTMLTDSGSSRSQAEVMERGSYLITKSDIQNIEDIVNNEVIQVLQKKGSFTAKNLVFSFQEPEIQTVEQKLDIDRFLIDNFKVKDITYFENRYGTSLEFLGEEEMADEGLNQLKEELTLAKGKKDRYDVNIKLTDNE